MSEFKASNEGQSEFIVLPPSIKTGRLFDLAPGLANVDLCEPEPVEATTIEPVQIAEFETVEIDDDAGRDIGYGKEYIPPTPVQAEAIAKAGILSKRETGALIRPHRPASSNVSSNRQPRSLQLQTHLDELTRVARASSAAIAEKRGESPQEVYVRRLAKKSRDSRLV